MPELNNKKISNNGWELSQDDKINLLLGEINSNLSRIVLKNDERTIETMELTRKDTNLGLNEVRKATEKIEKALKAKEPVIDGKTHGLLEQLITAVQNSVPEPAGPKTFNISIDRNSTTNLIQGMKIEEV